MTTRSGLTLAELLFGVFALAIAVGLLLCGFNYQRDEARRIRCRNNLNQLAKGVATYMDCGDNRFVLWPVGRAGCGTRENPQVGGAEWLATLYWTKIIPDPYVFLCPASGDYNRDGLELGSYGCPGDRPLSDDAVSYAGMGDLSVGIYLVEKQGKPASYATSRLAVRDDFPPNEPMACDDTEEPINHGSARTMNVLFWDSHVEYWTADRADPERGVGMKGGDLVHLRN